MLWSARRFGVSAGNLGHRPQPVQDPPRQPDALRELLVDVDRIEVARGAGGPERLKRLSVQFRGMGVMGEEVVVSGSVREVSDGVATVDSQAEQSGRRIIRNAVAEITVE